MFTPLHIISIVFTVVSVALLTWSIARKGSAYVDRWMKATSILIVFFDPVYWIWEWMTFGTLRWATTLPFYLCSLFWLLMPFAAFSKPGTVKQIAMSNIATVGLISGVMGFVLNYHLDVWGVISFVGIRSLLYHYLMIFIAVLLWVSDYYKPKAGDQWRAFVPVGIILIPGIILNWMYGYDYGYTAGGQGTAFTILSNRLPIPIFLIVLYALFFLLVWGVFYRKLSLIQKD